MGDRGEDREDRTALDESAVFRATELFVEEGRKLHEGLFAASGGEMWPSSRKGCSWGPGKRKAADTMNIHLKRERRSGEKRGGSRQNNRTWAGGGAEKERSGLNG